jgi:hypothetical protein
MTFPPIVALCLVTDLIASGIAVESLDAVWAFEKVTVNKNVKNNEQIFTHKILLNQQDKKYYQLL